jgi:hypothetical protein
MKKKNVNKLKIVKNKKSTDSSGMFNYVFEWFDGDEMILQEVKKIMADIYNMPLENFDLEEIINHKKDCCMVIDALNIEEVEL